MKRRNFLTGLLAVPAAATIPSVAKAIKSTATQEFKYAVKSGIQRITVDGCKFKASVIDSITGEVTFQDDCYKETIIGSCPNPSAIVPVNENSVVVIHGHGVIRHKFIPKWNGSEFEPVVLFGLQDKIY